MYLGDTRARDLDEDLKQKAIERIEYAMKNHCEKCSADTTNNIPGMCDKHLRMYGKINP